MTASTDPTAPRPRLVGVNHVALEVGDVDAALAFYGAIFTLSGVEREGEIAFLAMGDQFLALSQGRAQDADDARHFGLVVDDKEAVRAAVKAEGLPLVGQGHRLDFLDPWGNRIEVVGYADIQFERVPAVKRKLGIEDLGKTQRARREIADRGLS